MEITINSPKHGEFKFLIDDEDYEKVKDYRWYVVVDEDRRYVRAHEKKSENYSKVRLHRLIMNYSGNMFVDHINGNGLDNRKENLRICTNSENNMNSIKRKKGTSVYKGVSFDKSRNKYESYITINKKKIHLGRYETEEQAAQAYNNVVENHFGRFARPNENIMMNKGFH